MSERSLIFLIAAACASPSGIDVEFPESAPADRAKAIEIVAKPTFRGAAMADGTEVRFRADRGSFSTSEEKAETVIQTTAGVARGQLYPPDSAGQVTVTISFSNPNREPITREIKITLELIEPADSAQINVGCEASAIGALVANAPHLTLQCNVGMRNKNGTALAGGQVTFYAEAGQVVDRGGQPDGLRHFVYSIAPGSTPPKDVLPNAVEFQYPYLVSSADNRDYNPRDGVATILAVIRAHEAFDDLNGNGVYDEGTDIATSDEAEPFLDVDDDGLYDPSVGDRFIPAFDVNKNGAWDPPNGVYDRDTLVGRSVHILWTGDVQLTTDTPAPATSGNSPLTFDIFMLDRHNNPPAAYGSSDSLELRASYPVLVTVSGLITQPLNSDIGMSFDPLTGAFIDFTRDSMGEPRLRRFPITVQDNRGDEGDVDTMPVNGTVRYQPFPSKNDTTSKTAVLPQLSVTLGN